jgi:hypothetical protein
MEKIDRKIVSPQIYSETFAECVSLYSDSIINNWRNKNQLTSIMLGSNPTREGKSVCFDISIKLGLLYFREYWTLDAIYFSNKHESYFNIQSTYAEYLTIALEHENDSKTSHEEINKLAIFSSPLKVLITYPNKNEDDLLRNYADIITKADTFSDFTKYRKHLVIFGFLENSVLFWKYFLYGNKEFQQIKI